jgi:phage-related protein
MADVMWLQLGSDKLVLDSNATNVSLPDISRNYGKVQLFSNRQNVFGDGSMMPGNITYTILNKKGTATTSFNAARNTLNKWLNIDKSQTLYFYIVINSITCKVRVYPSTRSAESYSNYAISESITYEYIPEDAFFTSETLAENDYVLADADETISVTNNGTLPVFPLLTWTPTGVGTIFQMTLYTNYGIRYEYSFPAGGVVTIDCGTGIIQLAGVTISNIQTGGSILSLTPGANSINVISAAGTLAVDFYQRFN